MMAFVATMLAMASYVTGQNLPVSITPLQGFNSTCPAPSVNLTIASVVSTGSDGLNLKYGPPACQCADGAQWKRLVFLNMEDGTHQCPPDWELIITPVRGCRRPATAGVGCVSAMFNTQGFIYNRLCGQVLGYQQGSPDAFTFINNIDSHYLDGISLTHGARGSRQHIWSFLASLYETPVVTLSTCPCNTAQNWPHMIPEFVGNNYFCETGDIIESFDVNRIYTEDPLWDGKNCGPTTTCCEFNRPPWFCTALPRRTNEPLELRICGDEGPGNENVIISRIELYGAFSNLE